jgi:hypothetical protein
MLLLRGAVGLLRGMVVSVVGLRGLLVVVGLAGIATVGGLLLMIHLSAMS